MGQWVRCLPCTRPIWVGSQHPLGCLSFSGVSPEPGVSLVHCWVWPKLPKWISEGHHKIRKWTRYKSFKYQYIVKTKKIRISNFIIGGKWWRGLEATPSSAGGLLLAGCSGYQAVRGSNLGLLHSEQVPQTLSTLPVPQSHLQMYVKAWQCCTKNRLWVVCVVCMCVCADCD